MGSIDDEERRELVERHELVLLSDADGPLALNAGPKVGMSAHRADGGEGPTDLAAQEQIRLGNCTCCQA